MLISYFKLLSYKSNQLFNRIITPRFVLCYLCTHLWPLSQYGIANNSFIWQIIMSWGSLLPNHELTHHLNGDTLVQCYVSIMSSNSTMHQCAIKCIFALCFDLAAVNKVGFEGSHSTCGNIRHMLSLHQA